MENDNDLIRLYLDTKNDIYLKKLFNLHIKSLFLFVSCKVNNKSDVDDVVQLTLIKLWQNLHKFDQSKKFRNWMYKIANNIIIDRWRVEKETDVFNEQVEIETFCDDLEKSLNNTLNYEQVFLALDKIKPEQKLIIIMHFLEDLTFSEISEILNEPLNTVKSRLFRGIKQLKSIIKK